MKKKDFRLRLEDFPVFGEFVESSFLFDKPLFEAYSPLYANGFTEDFHSKLDAAREIALPQVITGKMRKATETQYVAQESMLKLLAHLERYCQLAAEELPFKMDALKLSGFRNSLRAHDSEFSLAGAKFVQQTLQPYLGILQEKGLTTGIMDEFGKLIEVIRTNNLEQNNLMNELRRKVEENMTLLNDLWKMIHNIMKTGKLIHQNNPVRKAEYTERNIASRVRLANVQNKKPEEVPPEEVITKETVKEEEPVASS